MSDDLILIYCPFPTLESARNAATALLRQGVAACCNLLPVIESHYWWEEKLTQNTEVVLLVKTTEPMAETVRLTLESLHPYEVPAILCFPAQANDAFAKWVHQEINRTKG